VVVLALILGLSGCDIPTACDTYAAPALQVQVRDAATNAAITGPEVLVVAREGAYVDSVRYAPAPLATERPGTYEIVVEAPSYQRWQRSGVRVREDGCHPRTVTVLASLQRAS